MDRPGQRPLRVLPTLEARRGELETCVFCPKLCRAACPVSNAEPRETLIPWGKMSALSFVAHGDVPPERDFSAPVWACTGCRACSNACDHQNDVAGTLLDGRAALRSKGIPLPLGAERLRERFDGAVATSNAGSSALAGLADRHARSAFFAGCAYFRFDSDAAAAGARVTNRLLGGIRLLGGCCGQPLLDAGDESAFVENARAWARSASGLERIVVSDAGCAFTLRKHFADRSIPLPPVTTLVEIAAARVGALREGACAGEELRWHDPCRLGRGLGIFDAPRTVLTRLLGHAPQEFVRARGAATCSGAGGGVPLTMPGVAKRMHDARYAEHLAEGGGTLVTACASSLHAFRGARQRAAGAGPRTGPVVDLAVLVARGLDLDVAAT